jgi:ATP-dependent Clp protease adaptor protein ClpS
MSTQVEHVEELLEDIESQPRIVLYNDNHNSFEHVILCLMAFCKHNLTQAEQCAQIVHSKGKYAVKHGDIDELVSINNQLAANDLTTEIQL